MRTLAWQTAGRRERGAPGREATLASAPAPARATHAARIPSP